MPVYQLEINDQTFNVEADSDTPLMWVLRDQLDLVGTKYGCGIGVRHRINADWFWGFQVGGRLSTNDYLDGYSPKASTSNDAYIMTQFFLSYRF